ncbi:murein biosynthesis integral membrane protein MurJ [soil metagenome]
MTQPMPSPADREEQGPVSVGIAGVAAVIFLGNAMSRVLGLIREQLAARNFGAGNDIAAFTVADNLNTLIFDLISNGMLQAALVPVMAIALARSSGGVLASEQVSGTLLLLALVAGSAIAFTGIILAPELVSLMTALSNDPGLRGAESRSLAIDSLRILLVSLPFLAGATVLTARLYAMARPGGPAVGALCRNGSVVVAILLLGSRFGVKSMAAGVLAGSIAMFVTQIIALHRNESLPQLTLNLGDPDVRQVFRLYTPVFLGLIVSSLVIVVDRNLAWGAEANAIGAMRYATALVQLVLGLIAAAVALAALPALSRYFASSDAAAFSEQLSRALRLVTVLIVPAVAGMAVLAHPIVRLIYEHGATDREASRLIALALLVYLPGHLLAAYDQVLIFSFYARLNTVLPVVIGVVAAGAYTVTAILLFDRYQMLGLVLANSLQLAVHTVIMVVMARQRFGNSWMATLPGAIAKVTTSALTMAVASWGLYRGVVAVAGDETTAARSIAVVLPVFAGIATYAALLRVFGVTELSDIASVVAQRVGLKTG